MADFYRDPDAIFFDVWLASVREDRDPLWVEPHAPLGTLVRLADLGLLSSGCVNGQDDYVWKLTPLGCLVGAAMNRDAIPAG
jgi:hypothetical protein